MKVLMFGWEFPPHISGGLGTACYGLTKSLSKLGMDITFVLPKVVEGYNVDHLRVLGVNQLKVKIAESDMCFDDQVLKLIKVDSLLKPYIDSDSYEETLADVRRKHAQYVSDALGIFSMSEHYGPNLMEEVRRFAIVGKYLGGVEQFDVIHAHDWMTFLAAIEAKRKSGKPFIAHVHATEFDRSGQNVNQDIYDIERFGMHEADKIVAVSNRTKQTIIERYGIEPGKVTVVHNGIFKQTQYKRDQITKNLNEKIVLFLGRITMQKGPEYFIEAARLVLDKVKNVRFVMAGTGDLLPKMIDRIAELRLADRFHFTGFLDGEKKERMYGMSDLFVMPSVSEPFGLTPVEAMLYDVPVIVSKQSGVSEVLDNAIKVDFWDVQKMADAMIKVLTDPELAKKQVKSIASELQKIDWDDSARKIVDLYYHM